MNIKFQYALNENGELVDIKTINEENRHAHSYVCLGCGEKLLPRLGSIKQHHFYHPDCACSSETYLHVISKLLFKKYFDESESFFFEYNIRNECSNMECKYRRDICTDTQATNRINLKEWYDICEIEKEIESNDGTKFIADVLLSNSKKKTSPLLVEIRVSHECSLEKKISGLKIIEISISSESQAYDLFRSHNLKESEHISFYNFKRFGKAENSVNFLRYVYSPDKGSYCKFIDCRKANDVLDEQSNLEINVFVPKSQYSYEDIREYLDMYYGYNSIESEISFEDDYSFQRFIALPIDFLNTVLIKGIFPKYYKVAVYGYHKFQNSSFVNAKLEKFLSDKLKSEIVHLCVLGVNDFFYNILDFGVKKHISIEYELINWDKNGSSAPYKAIPRLFEDANAIIVFHNKKDNVAASVIDTAKTKNIPMRIVNLDDQDEICPECGGRLIPRMGKYGMFYGCVNYPACGYKTHRKH